ncbi:RAVE protein 1 C terminal, partial [Geosmithia morbida]
AYLYNVARPNTSAPPSEDGQISVTSWPRSVHDPYYSNEDIGVLHAIVTAAQEQIEATPEPKPLPVAALFKAYDEILPQYGIDPDSDQHLSALVFRIGGEVSGGTLTQKFQAILSRMGIVLEFDENTTASIEHSPSLDQSASPSTRSLSPPPQSLKTNVFANKKPGSIPRIRGPATKSPQGSENWPGFQEHDAALFRSSPGPQKILEFAQRATLSSVMNRWRNAARQAQRGRSNASLATPTRRSTQAAPDPRPQLPREDEAEDFADVKSHDVRNSQPKHEAVAAVGQIDDNQGPVPRPSLVSSVGQWRISVPNQEIPDIPKGIPSHEQPDDSSMHPPEVHDSPPRPRPALISRSEAPLAPIEIDKHRSPEAPKAASSTPGNTTSSITPQRQPSPDNNNNNNNNNNNSNSAQQDALKAMEERLMMRATRAREIYIASQVFNHWADKTARRLEREAVARRHMIRFRCFRGWGNIPSTRAPVVDNLRVATAAQKLKRAVAENEAQLRLVASAASQAYHLKLVQKALNRWTCHILEQFSQQKAADQNRRKTWSKWLMRAYDGAEVMSTVEFHRRQANETKVLIRWLAQAERGASRQSAASEIGSSHQCFRCLGNWWNEAEANRKAQAYQQYCLMLRADYYFDIWNLQARADAFKWRCQYQSVSRVVNYWAEQSQIHNQAQAKAQRIFEYDTKIRSLHYLEHPGQNLMDLQTLEDRACLYIRSTRLLAIFDKTITRRKSEEKEALKRYLMMRYQQVSREKRKRNFFAALDHWKEAAALGQQLSSTAETFRAGQEYACLAASADAWSSKALGSQKKHYKAQLYHAQSWLGVWNAVSVDNEERTINVQSLWAARKHRQYQKVWSISTLQRNSQLHMASALSQRHDRDKCSRVFQNWKQRSNKGKNVTFEPFEAQSSRPTRFGSSSILRNNWRASSARRPPFSRREDTPIPGPIDTPTRWTGKLFPMGSVMSAGPMPAVEEAEEDQRTPLSIVGGDALSPTRSKVARGRPTLPSTTPRAPVPAHLERVFRPRPSQLYTFSQDRSGTPRNHQQNQSSRPLARNAESTAQSAGIGQGNEHANTVRNLSRSVTVDRTRTGINLPDPSFTSPDPLTLNCGFWRCAQVLKLGSMSAVLPGKPQSRLQGLATGCWDTRHIIIYITGNALTILRDPRTIIQTIYDDDETSLEAVAFDESTGKIACCTSTQIRVYKPLGLQESTLKWALELAFNVPHTTPDTPCTLSWGSSEELLLGTDWLSLYATRGEAACLWERELPSPVKSASLSYDSAYIVSLGYHDRLPKVWRRLAYGADEVRFDMAYLRHPSIVSSARWRKPYHVEQAVENVLYTLCTDAAVRIWTPTETPDGQHWRRWGRVDVGASIHNGQSEAHDVQLAFMIDSRDFIPSVERAVQDRMTDDSVVDDVALEHLVAVARKNPEICIAVDSYGLLSAWAFENLSSSTSDSPGIFQIAQIRSRQLESLSGFLSLRNLPHVEIQTYCDKSTGRLNILLHSFDGRIGVFTANIADLLDPTTNDKRLSLETIWSGHSASIKKMVRNFSGRAVVSRTRDGENIVWNHTRSKSNGSSPTLSRRCIVPGTKNVHRISVIRKGRFVVFLQEDSVTLWDCRSETATSLGECPYETSGKPLCLILLPRPNVKDYTTAHIAMVTSEGCGIVWEVKLPPYYDYPISTSGAGIKEFCHLELKGVEDLAYVLPVDPAGGAPVVHGPLDLFARDVAISYTHSGRVDFWTVRVDLERRHVQWLSTSSTETGFPDPALASGSMLKKAALVNSTRSRLTIWDIGGARLEFDEDYDTHNVIQDLDWTSTPDSQSILAVGFQYKVVLLSQMRFDYLNKGPAWAPIRSIEIRDLTPHPIGDSTWLSDGHLVIGAGNQMFVHDRSADGTDQLIANTRLPHNKDGTWDLFEAVSRFNGPLPVFHPQFVSQCILSGKHTLVRRVLIALYRTLKYHIAGEYLDDYLGLDVQEFYNGAGQTSRARDRSNGAYFNGNFDGDEEEETFTEEIAVAINEKLTKISIPQLSGHEQIQLADIIECAAFVERQRRSMDENGARFMLFVRQNALRKRHNSDLHISWREINWAYHSNSQDILTDFVSRQNHGSMLWEHARESGIFMWLSDTNAVRAQFEIIARNEYTKSEDKSPVDCSLFYLALRKKAVLQGLWRMAAWNKEQAATQKLLANNFDDPKWTKTALKNAYALLGKRRFAYAAAFFLLGNNLEGAVDICLHQMKDMQLGVAVARVYEGDDGPVLRKVLQETILPQAAQEGNRWLASWVFWMLGRKDMAVRALVTPVYTLIETPNSLDLTSRLFLTDDPALVVLYSQLRQQTLSTLRGASKVTPKAEWEFVLHSAKLYDRMGCDLLGLDLVRNWEFQKPAATGFGGEPNPLTLLQRRSSLVVDDRPADLRKSNAWGVESEKPKATPTTFEEPDAGSLLDSFGF